MSIAAHRHVVTMFELHPELTPKQRHVLRELADAAGYDTGRTWLSAGKLATRTGYHRSVILVILRSLTPYVEHTSRDRRTTIWQFPVGIEKLSTTARARRAQSVIPNCARDGVELRAYETQTARAARAEPLEPLYVEPCAPPPEFYAARDELRRRWRGAS